MQPELVVPAVAETNLRRSIVVAAVLGLVALIAAIPLHLVLGTAFACVGMGLGMVNAKLTQASVIRFAHQDSERPKRAFIGSVFGRLGLITLVALGLTVLFRPDGIGVIVGLGVFQVLMIVVASIPMIKELK